MKAIKDWLQKASSGATIQVGKEYYIRTPSNEIYIIINEYENTISINGFNQPNIGFHIDKKALPQLISILETINHE